MHHLSRRYINAAHSSSRTLPSNLRSLPRSSPRQGAPQRSQSCVLHALEEEKARLASLVTRLNSSPKPGDVEELLSVVRNMCSENAKSKPAVTPSINGRWVLLYTTKLDKAGMSANTSTSPLDSALSPLQGASDAMYQVFYKYVPILAGSSVGKQGRRLSGVGVTSRGNFQTIDTPNCFVSNVSRFDAFGRACEIDVQGSVVEVKGAITDLRKLGSVGQCPANRVRATFESFELTVGEQRLALSLKWLSPVGYVDTPYIDDNLRISFGDKGSLFIASRDKSFVAQCGADAYDILEQT